MFEVNYIYICMGPQLQGLGDCAVFCSLLPMF